ncbi:Catechol 2,3-dioxygenase [Terribacillus halophilus]|uniref:Catechol 2,3-dioxygenase n=1 Tax=Terribacillus halophilus TaxID=361279 RepID=A0A1G6PJ10_9BACI|nr:FosX/FosE/FosI family fosfomycin resistance hydrolase [Terribacillus halophilus]SDC80048.1 Catechol 2,3-dioxygenase [Terribacillus halophilus]
MIKGISHITFVVRDLKRTSDLFKEVLDAEEVYDSGDESHSLYPEKFFLIGGQWIAVMQAEEIVKRTYHHVAFEVNVADFEMYKDRIEKAGLEIRPSRTRISGEGMSIYFYDYDHNLFELHAGTLQERLKSYQKGEA